MLDEYRQPHDHPWVVAYSGGKDSTLVLHLLFEMVRSLAPAERRRQVHVVANDTLVESPLIDDHLKSSLLEIEKSAGKNGIPVTVTITAPNINQTFWVLLIGKGYMPPTRNFRWCTDKMKIKPTNRQLEAFSANHKGIVLLVGSRSSESQNRRRTLARHMKDGQRLNPHSTLKNCRIFPAIADLTSEEVWMILLQAKCPWGGDYKKIFTLYRNAQGGECPTVLSLDDAPSCGSTSPRFGCWTCTVVNKDKSLEGLVDSGFDAFEPLVDFRNWIKEIREDASRRMATRRDGNRKVRPNGEAVLGPFNLQTRKEILARLLELQEETGRTLISDDEIEIVEDYWRRDTVNYDSREAHLSLLTSPA